MSLFNPITLYITAGSLALGTAVGYKVRDWQCDAAVAKALEKAAKAQKEMQDAVGKSSATYEASRDTANAQQAIVEREVRTIYKTLPPPPVDCAAPNSAVGLLKGRVSSANASAASKPSE